MLELAEPGPLCGVFKNDRCAVDKTARCDRPVLLVQDRRKDAACRSAARLGRSLGLGDFWCLPLLPAIRECEWKECHAQDHRESSAKKTDDRTHFVATRHRLSRSRTVHTLAGGTAALAVQAVDFDKLFGGFRLVTCPLQAQRKLVM